MFKNRDLIIIYLTVALFFFVFVALDVLNGKSSFQFYSDSATWEQEAIEGGHGEELTTVNRNEFGPVTILRILGPQNYWAMFLFNIIIFLLSLYFISKKKEVNLRLFYILLMISPITFTSLFSSNKEIFALLSTCLIIYNHERRKIGFILIIAIVSYMARWQYTLFYIIYLFVFSKFNFIKSRYITFLILLIGITIGLFLFRNTLLYDVFSLLERKIHGNYEGGGMFLKMVELQDRYGYIVAFIPKTLLIFVAHLKNYDKFFDWTDVYNHVIQFLQTVFNCFVLWWCYKRTKFKFNYTFCYIAFIYLAIFGITPIFNPRYFYPAIVFICYDLCRKPQLSI